MQGESGFGDTLARVWGERGLPVDPGLTTAMRALLVAARQAWPELAIDVAALERFIAERASKLEQLDPARGADWAIASECARGDAKAIALFDARLVSQVVPSLRKLRLSATDLDAALQRLRTDMLVAAPGRAAGIGRYEGRGDLIGWLRVSAVRVGLKVLRGGGRTAGVDDDQLGERIAADGDDPELTYIKATYREQFRASFREALGSLDAEERTLLKQSLLDGLSVDGLARVYQVHRATAARRVAAARERLVSLTRQRFQARVRVSAKECDSIFRAMGSQLDVTFRQLSA